VPGPTRFARQTRKRRLWITLLVIALVTALSLLDHAAGVLPVSDDWHRYHGKRFEVMRVIDGDTIELRIPDRDRATTRVRLWGVGTPELNLDSDEPPEPGAAAASDFTRESTQGTTVLLELQRHQTRGKYGRLLAYVHLADGRDLNAELIERGYARSDDRWAHDRVQAYNDLEIAARSAQRGIWAN